VANTTTLLTLITTGACAAQIKARASTEAAPWSREHTALPFNQYPMSLEKDLCNYIQNHRNISILNAKTILKISIQVHAFD
jgi:hypothetical protein